MVRAAGDSIRLGEGDEVTKKQEQEVVDEQPTTLVISQMKPGAAIVANFDEMAAKVAEFVDVYRDLEVTEEYVPQAKKDRAYLNSFQKALDARRIEVEREYMAPVTAFKKEIAKLTGPIKEASESIDRQVKEYEERARIAKREECRKHYAEYAGALVDAVPFERIEDPSWALKSTSLMAAFAAIEGRVEKIAADDATIDSLNLAYPIDAHGEYFATLDLSAAIARSKSREAEVARALEMEARKAEAAAFKAEPLCTDAADPREEFAADEGIQPEPFVAEDRCEWTITFTGTRYDAEKASKYLKSQGLTGTIKPVRRG